MLERDPALAPLKDVIREKFGDGIMSVIDLTLHVEDVEGRHGLPVE